MVKKLFLLLALTCIMGLPFLFRNAKQAINAQADDTVIIITGHNENVRFELAQGFQKWYRERTGRSVFVDWRYIGGVSEIVRYLESMYTNGFRYHWEQVLGRPWTGDVQRIFVHRQADPARWGTERENEVCGAFFSSAISSGIDIFFGGGITEYVNQADLGNIVDSGFLRGHPELFCDGAIPSRFAGEYLWDSQGRWFGQVLSTFGILCNCDALAARGMDEGDVSQWQQLTDPRLFGTLALADPAKSSALLKAYETIIQQQIIFAIRREKILHPDQDQGEWENAALRRGWQRGLEVLQLISANARYYADAPTKMILDISSGNSMAGIIVDFMGQQQCAVDRKRSGHSRLRFILPRNGSAVSPDPIAILRGAPNESVAKLFLEFVLGEEGQKIVAFSVGSPGGPVRSELFRPAIHRRIYDASYAPYRSSVSDPYVELANFDYFPEYTAHHYNSLKWLIKFSCLIPHGELAAAWKAIIDARAEGRIADADAAQGILGNFSQLGYDEVRRTLEPILHQTNPGQALRLQRQLVQRFQCQYDAAREMARHGPGK